MTNNGTVKIHGKEYKTVALRVSEFRNDDNTKSWGIETELIHNNPDLVIMKATVKNDEGRVIGTGWAEEIRGSTNINKTSALENCETSAIGRALASVGLAGEEYASANEVSDAIIEQARMQVRQDYLDYMVNVRSLFDSISIIKNGVNSDDLSSAAEAWFELSDDEKRSIWRAPTKGGIFTIEEREIIGSKEFRESYYGPTPENTNE